MEWLPEEELHNCVQPTQLHMTTLLLGLVPENTTFGYNKQTNG
jgi:hypothetical protein